MPVDQALTLHVHLWVETEAERWRSLRAIRFQGSPIDVPSLYNPLLKSSFSPPANFGPVDLGSMGSPISQHGPGILQFARYLHSGRHGSCHGKLQLQQSWPKDNNRDNLRYYVKTFVGDLRTICQWSLGKGPKDIPLVKARISGSNSKPKLEMHTTLQAGRTTWYYHAGDR